MLTTCRREHSEPPSPLLTEGEEEAMEEDMAGTEAMVGVGMGEVMVASW